MPGIGLLRERVTFQAEALAADGGGGNTLTWADIPADPTVWARVAPLRGLEQLQGQQVQARATHKVTVRYRADVTPALRLLWRGRPMNIRAATNPDEGRKFLDLLCDEGVAT